jgi:Tfp pilus assembly protein PilX
MDEQYIKNKTQKLKRVLRKWAILSYYVDQKGQIVVLLLLTMLVALSIGLVVTQRSLTDLSTSTQSEQASRAFSAAEAGLERSLTEAENLTVQGAIPETQLNNQASADYKATDYLPNRLNQALEYPPLGKESVAQFWLSNPLSPNVDAMYTNSGLNLYFGDPSTSPNDKPGAVITIITKSRSTGELSAIKKYFDSDSTRVTARFNEAVNGANPLSCASTGKTSLSTNFLVSNYYCEALVDIRSCTDNPDCYPVVARARILYSNSNQKIALGPNTAFGTNRSVNYLPRQANLYTSTGKAGESEKRLQTFREKKVIPYFFDYAIFSTSNIYKDE